MGVAGRPEVWAPPAELGFGALLVASFVAWCEACHRGEDRPRPTRDEESVGRLGLPAWAGLGRLFSVKTAVIRFKTEKTEG